MIWSATVAVGLCAASHSSSQARERRVADPRRGARGGVRLDQRAHLVEVEQVGGVERADDRAAVGQHVDEPLALEHEQRLADRRARGAEAAGERLGPQPLAGRELAVQDRGPEHVVDPDRAGRRGHVHTKPVIYRPFKAIWHDSACNA